MYIALKNPLQNRLLFHVSHKLKDEQCLMHHHSQLKDSIEDQLCLASIHFLRSHYQQAIDVYKKILAANPDYIALNVYLALCYYKLDYYDVSLEILQLYLEKYNESPIAVNLKACNQYRLYNSKAAESEIKTLNNELANNELAFIRDIIEHNTVVFRNGDTALQVLPKLVDIIPEARLNLSIYYLKKQDTNAAFSLMNEFEPQVSHDFLLKAITYCLKGVETDLKDLLNKASEYFKIVGESSAECDTIIGRQSMASSFFLRRQFEEVLVYFNSIKTYFPHDDVFNFNYGQTLVQCGEFAEGEKCLLLVAHTIGINAPTVTTNSASTSGTIFASENVKLSLAKCLARAYIANGKSKAAWNLYTSMRHLSGKAIARLLRLIANDSYKAGEFVYAVRAFKALEQLADSSGERDAAFIYATARRCACAGVVQMFGQRRATVADLREAVTMLENERHSDESQQLAASARRWASEIGIYI